MSLDLKKVKDDINTINKRLFEIEHPDFKYGDKIRFNRCNYYGQAEIPKDIKYEEGIVKKCYSRIAPRLYGCGDVWTKYIEVDNGKGIYGLYAHDYHIEKL